MNATNHAAAEGLISSPFAQVAPALLERGYSPIPIKPGSKAPGVYSNGEWVLAKKWTRFCTEAPTAFQVGQWSKWPDAGASLALGRGLVAVDIDRDELIDPILAVLPPGAPAKVGKKGITLFFKADTDRIRSRNYRLPGNIGLLDLLSEGKQTLVPSSLHPETGEPYRWVDDVSLEEISIGDLPELTVEHVEAIEAVLRQFGWDAERETEEHHAAFYADDPDVPRWQQTDFFRRLNEDALANIGAWAPALQMPKGRFHGRVYRAVTPWRPSSTGRPMSQRNANLSISPGGIEDFGTGESFTALNVVMKALDLGQGQLDKAVVWLGERLGYDFSVVIDLRSSVKEEAVAERAAAESEPARDADVIQHPAVVGAATPAVPVAAPTTPRLAVGGVERPDFLAGCENVHPTGLVATIADWISSTAIRPCPELSRLAALSFVSTLIGRRFRTTNGLAPNLFCIGLARTGWGKEHVVSSLVTLAIAADLGCLVPAGKVTSDAALESLLLRGPNALLPIDEIGLMLQGVTAARATPWEAKVREALLTLYSRSGGVYLGKERGDVPAKRVVAPNLNVYGTSTPETFFRALTDQNITDGLLNRFVVVRVKRRPQCSRPITETISKEPPADLVNAVKRLWDRTRKGYPPANKDLGSAQESQHNPILDVVPWSDDAKAFYLQCFDWADALNDSGQENADLWLRFAENVAKIGLTLAVGRSPYNPVIEIGDLRFAAGLVFEAVADLAEQAAIHICGSRFQEACSAVYNAISTEGANGIAKSILKRRGGVAKLTDQEIDAALARLEDTGRVVGRLVDRGRPGNRYFAV